MSDSKYVKFKEELSSRIINMINTEDAVNNGQLYSFFEYFLSKNKDYDSADWLKKLEDERLRVVLRILMVYSTMALTIHDDKIFAAAVELLPTNLIPAEYVKVAKDTLRHIEENPADETRTLFIQGLGSQQFPMRMAFLSKTLNNALMGVL